jgi:hypothetical protein
MSYDAANAIIEALKVALPSATDAKSARAAIVEATNKVSFGALPARSPSTSSVTPSPV